MHRKTYIASKSTLEMLEYFVSSLEELSWYVVPSFRPPETGTGRNWKGPDRSTLKWSEA